ncbi:MAG: homoserine dehydrogenase [Candidatus Methanomethylophilaceae archaeon]|nr:homoserine dehydrogenase [Candidatus Methanomethylophilaceae archaeon]
MIVNAELFVKDLPGQLVGSLEPISLVDGNIMGVVHNREVIVNNRICLNVTFEVEDRNQLCKLRDLWQARDIIIARMGSGNRTYSMEYMLIGDFDAQGIEGLINTAQHSIALDSVDIRYSSKTGPSSKRTAMISVKTQDARNLDRVDEFLDEECRKNGITYVRGV